MTAKMIYRFIRPDNGKVVFAEKGGRAVRWATFALFSDGWAWVGYSSQEDFAKASKAARGTNPYASEYTAVPLTVVTPQERDAELNPSPVLEKTQTSARTPVAHVDMLESRRGLILVSGLSNFTESPQGRIGYDEGQRAWFVDDDENGIVYRAKCNTAITAYIGKLSRMGEMFDPKSVTIEINREY